MCFILGLVKVFNHEVKKCILIGLLEIEFFAYYRQQSNFLNDILVYNSISPFIIYTYFFYKHRYIALRSSNIGSYEVRYRKTYIERSIWIFCVPQKLVSACSTVRWFPLLYMYDLSITSFDSANEKKIWCPSLLFYQ